MSAYSEKILRKEQKRILKLNEYYFMLQMCPEHKEQKPGREESILLRSLEQKGRSKS